MTLHAHAHVCDVAHVDNKPSRDPTKCSDQRRRLETIMRKALSDWRKSLKKALLVDDALGMGVLSIHSFSPTDKLDRVMSFARAASARPFDVKQEVLSVLAAVYKRGYLKAYSEAGISLEFTPTYSDLAIYLSQVMADVKGIVEATIQRITASIAMGVSAHRKPKIIWAAISDVLDKVADRRLRGIPLGIVSQVYNHAKLRAYMKLGVGLVGIVPEIVPVKVSRDAKRMIKDISAPFWLLGQPDEKVAFATAGDERVCPICDELEGEVYTVLDAFGIIPVHPNCRCTWIPYGGITAFKNQLRSERGYRVGDYNTEHVAKGEKGGEFTTHAQSIGNISRAERLIQEKIVEEENKREFDRAVELPYAKASKEQMLAQITGISQIDEHGTVHHHKIKREHHDSYPNYIDLNQSSALHKYIGSGGKYRQLNDALREGKHLSGELKEIDTGIEAIMKPLPKEDVFYRVVSGFKGDAEIQAGDILKFGAYTSASRNPQIALGYHFKPAYANSFFEIHNKVGDKALATNPEEEEIILDKHGSYRVKEVRKGFTIKDSSGRTWSNEHSWKVFRYFVLEAV